MYIEKKHKIIFSLLMLGIILLVVTKVFLPSTTNDSSANKSKEDILFLPSERNILNEDNEIDTEIKNSSNNIISKNIYLSENEQAEIKKLTNIISEINDYRIMNYTETEIHDKEMEYYDFLDESIIGKEFVLDDEHWSDYLFLENMNYYVEKVNDKKMYVGKIIDYYADSTNTTSYNLADNDILYEVGFVTNVELADTVSDGEIPLLERYADIVTRFYITKDFKIKKFEGEIADVY